ncbi:monosaccharide ABC transporter substrate-binding protein (CUT2 family) [Rhodococcus wratislaviensis]|uniref:Sugar ABC transporter periplasmic solute-binding protein n=2 Tax=Rhodococcus wratislaviensis TaxID=44752 RepID=A0AB38F5A1_RHOWR|nr:substrate-binding domain-containing protein [Rhodococcus wratislaviensis]REE70984.1 monosaccharide ABC transporter substrate-binding protein (CUT2 family) [Rhodococcus wratislaviensis]GAF46346.1 putative ABC transporter substrate-binding protein [Rhodococcus wratislaviensis NBRC 100605]SPZ34520.1 sugar ABC transporter periplasmic solute-binding protein [Rhodococcus wratislaviensis]
MKTGVRAFGVAAAVAAVVLGACAAPAPRSDDAAEKVFFLLPNTTTTRFVERDEPLFTDFLELFAPEATVTVRNAEGDPARQQSQVESAIADGASVLVLISTDARYSGGALTAAAEANVPVVLYDHDAVGGPADVQVIFDPLEVGRRQGSRAADLIAAMPGDGVKIARVEGNLGEYGTRQFLLGQDEYLQPLADSGKIRVVCETAIDDWDPAEGQAFAEECLTRENNDIALFVTMNDDLGGGIVAALAGRGLAGRIPVTGGQDANLAALQLIAQGTLDNTIFKNLSDQAKVAAQLTTSILHGEGIPEDMINGTIDNQYMAVPTVFLPVQNITKDNLSVVVDSGFYTWQQICAPDPASAVCGDHS